MSDAVLAQPALAFAAGLATIAAPCVLPLLPVVLGATAGGRRSARPLFVVGGFALSFTVLALVFGSVQPLLGLEPQTVRDAAALLLVAFGASMAWPGAFRRLSRHAGGLLDRIGRVGDGAGDGWAGGVLVGLSLGAIWTPCAGPVLATLLTLVAAQSNWSASAGLLLLYASGAALPMLAIAYGGQWVATKLRMLTRFAHRLQQGLGLLVAAVGLLTLTGYDTVVTLGLADLFPTFSQGR